jgi:hypothetical protein
MPTATSTPTNTPTSTATATNTPIPAAAPLAAPAQVPLTARPNACKTRIWPPAAGVGFLLMLTGTLAQVIRARSAGKILVSDYATDSMANVEKLDVHTGKVDFGDGSGDPNPSRTWPIAITIVGTLLALVGAAGLLNLIPCSGWMTTAGGMVFAGVTTPAIHVAIIRRGAASGA